MRRSSPRAPLLCLLVPALLLLCCQAAWGQSAQLARVGNFSSPLYVAAPPGDHERLFVVEQGGRIQVVRGGATQSPPFLDISTDVLASGEQGLLSMAFAPDYQSSGLFYVYYTDRNGDNRVEEFRRSSASGDRADLASRRLVLPLPHPTNANHNGGQLQFGPDGLLYVATGDGGSGCDPPNNAQNVGSPLGKLLRIDPRPGAGGAYQIPSDNPFVGTPGARGEVYSYGLRNPWRFSFDRGTGDIAIGDVGQSRFEEIDFRRRGEARGANFGWDAFEGNFPNPCEPKTISGHVPPVIQHSQTDGWRSIIGGYVVRDSSLPSLAGRYVYGDFYLGRLYSAVLASGTASDDRDLGLAVPSLAGMGEDAAGCVYAASLGGPVYRLAASSSATAPCPAPSSSGGGTGTPPPPGGGAGASDTAAPALVLSGRLRQRVLRRRAVLVAATCGEPCTVRATGHLSVGTASSLFRLGRTSRRLPARERRALKLRVPRRALPLLRRAFRRGRTARASVRVRARDAAGNSRSRTVRLRLRR